MSVTITESNTGSGAYTDAEDIAIIKVAITAAASGTLTRAFSGIVQDIYLAYTSGTVNCTVTDESGKDILGGTLGAAGASVRKTNSDLGGGIPFRIVSGTPLTATQTGAGAGTIWIYYLKTGPTA